MTGSAVEQIMLNIDQVQMKTRNLPEMGLMYRSTGSHIPDIHSVHTSLVSTSAESSDWKVRQSLFLIACTDSNDNCIGLWVIQFDVIVKNNGFLT